jgi:competence protein ComEC
MGDTIRIKGVLRYPINRLDPVLNISQVRILASDAIESSNRRWKDQLKERVYSSLVIGHFDDPFFPSAMFAMLTGDTSTLSYGEKTDIRKIGIMHFFAISGFHMGILAYALSALLKLFRLERPIKAIVTVIVCVFYIWLCDFPISGVRAVVMIALYCFAIMIRRKADAFPVLVAAAFGMLVADPGQIYDAGFQLSFAIVAGIIQYAIPLQTFLEAKLKNPLKPRQLDPWSSFQSHLFLWFMRSLTISSTAYFVSLPIIVAHFENAPILSILVNCMLAPVFAVALILGFSVIFLGFLGLGSVCLVLNKISWSLIFAIRYLVDRVVEMEWTSIELPANAVVGLTGMMIILLWMVRKPSLWTPKSSWFLILPILSILAVWLQVIF